MKIQSILIFSLLLCLFGCSQEKDAKTADNAITVKWSVSDSLSRPTAGEQASVITLFAGEQDSLPKKGWALYFNLGQIKIATSDSSHIQAKHINGDLFLLEPDSLFAGLASGDSLKIKVVSRVLKNITDFPAGFYLAFGEEDLDKTLPVSFIIDTPTYVKQRERLLNARIYDQNSRQVAVDTNQLSLIFPTPKSYTRNSDEFLFDKQVSIATDTLFAAEAEYLASVIGQLLGSKIGVDKQKNAVITFQRKHMDSEEAYELEITKEHIIIQAGSRAGAFYAVQSIKSLISPEYWGKTSEEIKLPGLIAQDEPRFSHRAFMLDVARNFQPKEEVLKVLDLMALYKLNVFHFHLVEDEGWRLEIPGLPELTQVGATRGHTTEEKDHILPSYGSGPNIDNPVGSGFYSREDFIEILRYAKDRHIKVITEIETPGHARAAIRAMDVRYRRLSKEGKEKEATQYLLHDVADQSSYQSVQGFDDNVMNLALPSVYTFLTKVTDELITMYAAAGAPLQTIHFGGDEVPVGVWEKSPAVQKLLATDATMKSPDDLWYYYFNKLNKMLASRNLFLSGWEEAGLRKVMASDGKKKMIVEKRFANSNFHLDVWNNLSGNEDLAYKLANAGYKVVLTNVTNMYIDLAYNPSFYEMGQYWGGYVDVEKPFSFIPFNYYQNQTEDERGNPLAPDHFDGKESLTAFGKANIVGLQAPLWAEKITSTQKLEYLLLPKILGMVERAWAPDPDWAQAYNLTAYHRSWSAFLYTIAKRELSRLDFYNGGYAYRIPTPGLKKIGDKIYANVQLPGYAIRYTMDGSEPNVKSSIYQGPILEKKGLVFKVFNKEGRGGRSVTW